MISTGEQPMKLTSYTEVLFWRNKRFEISKWQWNGQWRNWTNCIKTTKTYWGKIKISGESENKLHQLIQIKTNEWYVNVKIDPTIWKYALWMFVRLTFLAKNSSITFHISSHWLIRGRGGALGTHLRLSAQFLSISGSFFLGGRVGGMAKISGWCT